MLATARLAQFFLAWIGRGLIALIVLQILGLAHPDTEAVARAAQGWLTERAVATGRMIVAYLPNLFTIVATLWAARAFLALNRRFFGSIENGGLQLPGFDQRWAVPTRQIIAALTWITAASTVLPLLPGAASPVFRGASVLAGVLISLGSGPAMTNIAYSTEADRCFHLMPIKIDIFGAHRGDQISALTPFLLVSDSGLFDLPRRVPPFSRTCCDWPSNRSSRASATVGSVKVPYHLSTGNWLVTSVARLDLSSMISKSVNWASGSNVDRPRSSRTSRSTLASFDSSFK